jgi:hypothetical protein
MAWQARILADSTSPAGARLTSWVLTYPRFIHAELLTHRELSRCSSSSRAMPIEKMIRQVIEDPAMPIHWGRNRSGMQAREELSDVEQFNARLDWLRARDRAVETVKHLTALGLHKQVANRLLEPWSWITVVMSTTDHANLFHLRDHDDAQPEFHKLATMLRVELEMSKPRELRVGEWHLPFHMPDRDSDLNEDQLVRVCTGRAARVSHLTHDGKRDPVADLVLHDKLVAAGHWSPFEHCAIAAKDLVRSGNFVGFVQYRKMFKSEYASSYSKPDQFMTTDEALCLALERQTAADDALYHLEIALKAGCYDQAEAFLEVAKQHTLSRAA